MAKRNFQTIAVGEIYRHERFYEKDDEYYPKYFLVLAIDNAEDIIARLLTSQAYSRPRNPRCYNGLPYPSFYLGVLGGSLDGESWLDLRGLPDFESVLFQQSLRDGVMHCVTHVDWELLCPILECVAQADDTTVRQERNIRDQRNAMGCQ